MDLNPKTIFRLAELIRSRLQCLARHHYQEIQRLIYCILDRQHDLEQLRRHLTICLERHWPAAANDLAFRTNYLIRDLPYTIDDLQQVILKGEIPLPTSRQLVEELRHLSEEFNQVEYEAEEHTISVFTDPIELEGVYLGAFELRLELDKISESQNPHNCLVVEALDPHPASCNEDVTHPHVSDGYLCAGEGAAAMLQALHQGRLVDYFQLAKAVLENYNSSSPYVKLDDWEGTSCHNCGYSVHSDEVYYCESCGENYCEECMGYCDSCDSSYCRECLTKCPACEESRCEDCMQPCAGCQESTCLSCLNENNLCPSCIEDKEQNDEESLNNQSTSKPTNDSTNTGDDSATPETIAGTIAETIAETIAGTCET